MAEVWSQATVTEASTRPETNERMESPTTQTHRMAEDEEETLTPSLLMSLNAAL